MYEQPLGGEGRSESRWRGVTRVTLRLTNLHLRAFQPSPDLLLKCKTIPTAPDCWPSSKHHQTADLARENWGGQPTQDPAGHSPPHSLSPAGTGKAKGQTPQGTFVPRDVCSRSHRIVEPCNGLGWKSCHLVKNPFL